MQGEEQRLALAQEGAARAAQDAKEAQAIAASERKRYTHLLCKWTHSSLVMTHKNSAHLQHPRGVGPSLGVSISGDLPHSLMHDSRLYSRFYDPVTRVWTDTLKHDGSLYVMAGLFKCDACASFAV